MRYSCAHPSLNISTCARSKVLNTYRVLTGASSVKHLSLVDQSTRSNDHLSPQLSTQAFTFFIRIHQHDWT
jgi:hypothetical protein